MTTLCKPESRSYDVDKKVSQLFFRKGAIAPPGEYWMNGGISWPTIGEDDSLTGYAIVCGMNVQTRVTYIFEETEFLVIDHIVGDGSRIEYKGICTWLNNMWSNYFNKNFYWHQEYETNKRYLRQVLESRMISPKPVFIEVAWQDDIQGLHRIMEKEELGQLIYSEDGWFCKQYRQQAAEPDVWYPALHSVKCCLMGMEWIRYRAR